VAELGFIHGAEDGRLVELGCGRGIVSQFALGRRQHAEHDADVFAQLFRPSQLLTGLIPQVVESPPRSLERLEPRMVHDGIHLPREQRVNAGHGRIE
jgi:hypothetical protein